jgi:hypothetical protein
MATCPFCRCDPYHYVDIGVGFEAVAVTCCEAGIEFFDHNRQSETVTLYRDEFMEIGRALAKLRRPPRHITLESLKARAPGTGGSREGSMPNPDEKDISAAPQPPSVSSEIERLRAELEKADEVMRLIIQQAMTVEQAENVARDFLCWRRKSASPVPQNGEG